MRCSSGPGGPSTSYYYWSVDGPLQDVCVVSGTTAREQARIVTFTTRVCEEVSIGHFVVLLLQPPFLLYSCCQLFVVECVPCWPKPKRVRRHTRKAAVLLQVPFRRTVLYTIRLIRETYYDMIRGTAHPTPDPLTSETKHEHYYHDATQLSRLLISGQKCPQHHNNSLQQNSVQKLSLTTDIFRFQYVPFMVAHTSCRKQANHHAQRRGYPKDMAGSHCIYWPQIGYK